MRGIGVSETADTWTFSKKRLKSRSDMTFFAEDFYSSFTCGFDFFSGVPGIEILPGDMGFPVCYSVFTFSFEMAEAALLARARLP